jgi:hypothetical protein
MQVPFEAYAEDCSFSGELAMTADRMSDFLSSTTEFEVINLTCRALDDGRVVEAMYAPLVRDDLCLVVAGEPEVARTFASGRASSRWSPGSARTRSAATSTRHRRSTRRSFPAAGPSSR